MNERPVFRQIILDLRGALAATVSLAVVIFASTVVLARLLPVEQFGKVSFLLLLFGLTSTLDAVRPVTIYFGNRYPEGRQVVFASVFWLNIGIGVVAGASMGMLAFVTSPVLVSPADMLCLAGAFALYFVQSAYWGWADSHGLVARTAWLRAFTMSALYVAFVLLAVLEADSLWYSSAVLAAGVIGVILFLWLCVSKGLVGGSYRPSGPMMQSIGREAGRYMQFNLATLVLATIDRLAISSVGGARHLGLYSGCFELATKPFALLRTLQAVLNPHITRAVSANRDVYGPWALATKWAFGLTSVGVWLAVYLRDWLIGLVLGVNYAPHSDVFGFLVLSQAFVVVGYSCALLLNSSGDFQLQRSYYLCAALAMLIAVLPVASLAGIEGVAVLYLVVRTVDILLLVAAVRFARRRVVSRHACLIVVLWLSGASAAWLGQGGVMLVVAMILGVMLSRMQLTRAEAPAGPGSPRES